MLLKVVFISVKEVISNYRKMLGKYVEYQLLLKKMLFKKTND